LNLDISEIEISLIYKTSAKKSRNNVVQRQRGQPSTPYPKKAPNFLKENHSFLQ
jgi:hypothetical protein